MSPRFLVSALMVLFVALFMSLMVAFIALTASPMAFIVSVAAAFLACLVSLGAVVWVAVASMGLTVSAVSLSSLVFAVMVFAAFLATAASSLASPTPRVFPDLEVSSILVVLSLTSMVGSLTSWGAPGDAWEQGVWAGSPPCRALVVWVPHPRGCEHPCLPSVAGASATLGGQFAGAGAALHKAVAGPPLCFAQARYFLLVGSLVAVFSCLSLSRLGSASAGRRMFASSRSRARRLFSLSVGLWGHLDAWVLTYALVSALVVMRSWYGIVQVHPMSAETHGFLSAGAILVTWEVLGLGGVVG